MMLGIILGLSVGLTIAALVIMKMTLLKIDKAELEEEAKYTTALYEKYKISLKKYE